MQNLYSINPRSRHNLPPHLEIITFNFPKVFQNFKTIEKKSQRSEGPPPLLFTIKFNLFLKNLGYITLNVISPDHVFH